MAARILQKLNVFMAIQLLLHPIYHFKHYSMRVRKQLSLGWQLPFMIFPLIHYLCLHHISVGSREPIKRPIHFGIEMKPDLPSENSVKLLLIMEHFSYLLCIMKCF